MDRLCDAKDYVKLELQMAHRGDKRRILELKRKNEFLVHYSIATSKIHIPQVTKEASGSRRVRNLKGFSWVSLFYLQCHPSEDNSVKPRYLYGLMTFRTQVKA